MHRLANGTQVAVLPAAPAPVGTPGYGTDGDPGAGQLGSIFGAAEYNRHQEELMAFLTAAGIPPDHEDHAQVLEAVRKLCGVPRYQLFTATGTFTVPAHVYSITVHVWGGGGGGSSGAGGSGGSGGYSRKRIPVAPGDVITVTIGAGGAAAVDQAAAGNGGTTSFGSHCSATGGTGGATGPGLRGVGSGGDINMDGNNGLDLDGTTSQAPGGVPPAWIGRGHGGYAAGLTAGTGSSDGGTAGACLVEY